MTSKHVPTTRLFRGFPLIAALVVSTNGCVPAPAPAPGSATAASGAAPRWWKGNTHTHSLWSDGDHYPEMIADWYRREGYHFLAMTDHNPPPPEKWLVVADSGPRRRAYESYLARFGNGWVGQRQAGDTLRVRVRRLDEYRGQLDAAGSFLLIPGEEIPQYRDGKAAHMNAINLVGADSRTVWCNAQRDPGQRPQCDPRATRPRRPPDHRRAQPSELHLVADRRGHPGVEGPPVPRALQRPPARAHDRRLAPRGHRADVGHRPDAAGASRRAVALRCGDG